MQAGMTTILTVLRSSADFTPEQVYRLYEQTRPFPFLCVSDTTLDVPFVTMKHNWPLWWGKIEALRIPGPVLYMDLDTAIVGDLTPLLDVSETRKFVMLKPFSKGRKGWASGLMAWNADISELYARFIEAPDKHIKKCTTFNNWGDQGFISNNTPVKPETWQDLLPGKVVSWKTHCKDGIPDEASVVCFHGRPRPWEIGL